MRGRQRLSQDLGGWLEDPMINLTPLIDVVFVVLIIFILIAPLLEVDKIELASSGQKTSSSMSNKSEIAIYVRSDNSIWFRDHSVTPVALRKELEIAHQQFPQATPHLYHDKTAHFGTYQAVKGAVEGAGFSQMDVVLTPSGR